MELLKVKDLVGKGGKEGADGLIIVLVQAQQFKLQFSY